MNWRFWTQKQIIYNYQTQTDIYNYQTQTDNWLIEYWAISKNQDAYLEIYDRYNQKVFAFSLNISGDVMLAEDGTQEVFKILLEKPETFRSIENLEGYLIKMAHNNIKKYFLRNALEVSYEEVFDELNIETDSNMFYAVSSSEDKELLWKIVSGLKPQYREAFCLDLYLELSDKEIAEEMNISIKTARNLVQRSYEKVKKRIYRSIKKKGL